jgi:hypothetical protein
VKNCTVRLSEELNRETGLVPLTLASRLHTQASVESQFLEVFTMNMKLWSSTFAAVACAATVAVVAQSSTPQTPSSSASSSGDKTVTITGCIQRAPSAPGATGTTGTAGSSAASPSFILNNATSESSASASSSASMYRLDGDDSKLTPHVGHKVAITGMLESASAGSSAGSAAGSAAGATGGSSSRSMSTPRLKVESIKMVSASCTE